MLMQCEQAPSIPTRPTSQSDILSQQSIIQHLRGFYDKRINGVIYYEHSTEELRILDHGIVFLNAIVTAA